MAYRRWKPSQTSKREFAEKMAEIEKFCSENSIDKSRNGDSYYFTVDGQQYRVSNHSVESSNAHAYNWLGEQIREKYHEDGRREDVTYIHASKTRIIEIYNDIKAGYKLDGRGKRVS